MISPSDTRRGSQIRTYDRMESAVFLRTTEEFGGLSNMAGGFPLVVNGLHIFTSEALYQACRFPHMPEVQRLIIAQASPMTAKMKSKPYRLNSRPDWNQVRVKVMRWCLRVKLAQNWARFSELLLATGNRPIVEASRRDDFWGAKPVDNRTLVGMNVLGRLLMELREEVRSGALTPLARVESLSIPDFLLDGRPIQPVIGSGDGEHKRSSQGPERRVTAPGPAGKAVQIAMFDQPLPELRSGPQESKGESHALVDGLEPYPAYKNSGVPWLGQVPEHWDIVRAKWLFRKMERPVRTADEVVTCFRDGIVTLRKNRRARGFTESLKEIGYQGIRRGDLVIHAMDAFAGAVGVADSDGKATPVYSVCEPAPNVNAHFYAYMVREMARSEWVLALAKGIRERSTDFRFEAFASQPVLLAPVAEQSAIVRFLDHADRRIQRYIRGKKKLIALLNEQKQAIIHRAVTRGLDPNVRLEPSGEEWPGDVPEHWEVVRLGRLIDLTTGFPFKSEGFSQYEGDIRLLRGINIAPNRIRWGRIVRWPANESEAFAEYQLREGDIVLGMDRPIIGGGVRVAQVTKTDLPALVLQRVARIRPRADLDAEFTLLILAGKSFADYLAPIFTGISVPHISPEQISSFRIALPSHIEQLEIVRQLRTSTAALDRLAGAANREIDLLRDCRTRLIADVVTGKLDVRKAAARLPEVDDEEAEPIDAAEALMEEDEDGAAGDLDSKSEEAVA